MTNQGGDGGDGGGVGEGGTGSCSNGEEAVEEGVGGSAAAGVRGIARERGTARARCRDSGSGSRVRIGPRFE